MRCEYIPTATSFDTRAHFDFMLILISVLMVTVLQLELDLKMNKEKINEKGLPKQSCLLFFFAPREHYISTVSMTHFKIIFLNILAK